MYSHVACLLGKHMGMARCLNLSPPLPSLLLSPIASGPSSSHKFYTVQPVLVLFLDKNTFAQPLKSRRRKRVCDDTVSDIDDMIPFPYAFQPALYQEQRDLFY